MRTTTNNARLELRLSAILKGRIESAAGASKRTACEFVREVLRRYLDGEMLEDASALTPEPAPSNGNPQTKSLEQLIASGLITKGVGTTSAQRPHSSDVPMKPCRPCAGRGGRPGQFSDEWLPCDRCKGIGKVPLE